MAVPTRSAEAPRSSTNEGSAEAPVPSTSESTLQPLHGNPAGYGLSAALGRSAESTTDIATVCVFGERARLSVTESVHMKRMSVRTVSGQVSDSVSEQPAAPGKSFTRY